MKTGLVFTLFGGLLVKAQNDLYLYVNTGCQPFDPVEGTIDPSNGVKCTNINLDTCCAGVPGTEYESTQAWPGVGVQVQPFTGPVGFECRNPLGQLATGCHNQDGTVGFAGSKWYPFRNSKRSPPGGGTVVFDKHFHVINGTEYQLARESHNGQLYANMTELSQKKAHMLGFGLNAGKHNVSETRG
ncbi:MAG: hypothetical protein Q9191_000176 [Dirinaria sp. TL-2023a]